MILVPRDGAAEVVQPAKEPFDLPAAAIAAQLTAVLGNVESGRTVWRDQLDAAFRQARIEWVANIDAVANQPDRPRFDEPLVERLLDERDLAGVGACDTNGERKTMAVCDCRILWPLPFQVLPTQRPPFPPARRWCL